MAITSLGNSPGVTDGTQLSDNNLEETTAWSASGDNRFLVAYIGQAAAVPPTVSAVKWGGSTGTDLTYIGRQRSGDNQYHYVELWGLVAPSTSSLKLYVTFASAPDECAVWGRIWGGVDQSTPTGTPAGTPAASGNATVNVSAATGDVVTDAMIAMADFTVTCSQTQIINTSVQSAWTFGISSKAGETTTTMTWTGIDYESTILGVALKAASAAVNTDYSPSQGSATLTGLAALLNPQFAAPSADATDGNWTPSTGSDLYAVLDDTDDTDYAQSGSNPSNDSMTVKLATITDPSTDDGFIMEWTAGATGATGQVVGSLRQGNSPGTEIAAWTHTGLPVGSFASFSDAVTSAQAGNITDYSDLYFRVVAS